MTTELSDIEQFYLSNNVDDNFNEEFYLNIYPETKDFYKGYCDTHNITDKERLYYHYCTYTKHNSGPIVEFYLNTQNIIDVNFNEQQYLDYNPEARNYCKEWADKHNVSERQRLFHHYIIFKDKKPQKPIDKLDIKTTNTNVVLHSNQIRWQLPACTEKFYFYNHAFAENKTNSTKEYYIAFPWATLIDTRKCLGDKNIDKIQNILITKEGKKHTICQHIRWRQLVETWEQIGITDVHLCHYEQNIENTDKISFHSWPIIAANYENKQRSRGLSVKHHKHKQYLASFIGAYKDGYRSSIRLDLKDILQQEKQIIYELKDEWFYESLVFGEQVKQQKLSQTDMDIHYKETQKYNAVLSDSIFSLCPEGTGPNTIRLWESMAIGAIPVIFSDEWIPPQVPDLSWHEFAVFIKHEDISNTVNILRSFSAVQLEQMQLQCINAYKHFRQMSCFSA